MYHIRTVHKGVCMCEIVHACENLIRRVLEDENLDSKILGLFYPYSII